MSLVCTLSLNQLVDFDQTYTETPMGHGKEGIRFWRPWPHFQGHTSTLSYFDPQKSLSAPHLLNQMMDSGQTLCIVSLGYLKELVRFWWPWPNFQGHHTIKTVKMSLVCTLLNQMVDFDQTYTDTPLRHGKEMIRFWWPWPHILRSHQHFECQILTKKSLSAPCLLNQMMDFGQRLCIVSLG